MPKANDYKITLYPAHREGSFVVTKFDLFGGTYPTKDITAAGMPDLVSQVTAFAEAHGKGCRASVKCLAARKPPGFKATTENLTFNLEDKPVGTASAA